MSSNAHWWRRLGCSIGSINSRRAATDPTAWTFFKPVQIDCQLADFLVQLRDHFLALLRGLAAPLKKFGQPLPNGLLPLPHQKGMHLVLARNLRRRFDSN
jgi:hypothetical protein